MSKTVPYGIVNNSVVFSTNPAFFLYTLLDCNCQEKQAKNKTKPPIKIPVFSLLTEARHLTQVITFYMPPLDSEILLELFRSTDRISMHSMANVS